jgi:SAM-dependent methyltransferase
VAPLDLSLSAYPALWESLDGLATALILRTLRSLEAFSRDRETVTVDTLLSSYRIQSTYRPLMRRWLEALVAEGLLVNRGEEYESPRPLPEPDLETVRSEAARQLAELPFLLEYLDRCGEKLPAVLQGTESPLETIFPGGSFETADHLYSRWPMARYFNEIVGAVVETATRAMDPGRPLRIVEIGAGTGGTTAAVLPRVPAERTSYVVTDTSDVFLSRAARRFAEFPFVSHAILDIERSPEAQGFARRGFDLAIAANVFHATRDLRETVGHAATLLAPGGLLLILETVCHPRWFDVSFGLIEGWQRFADERRRENPLLGPKEWEEVLHESGLERSVAFPPPGSPAEALIDRVFVAQAPGRTGTAPPEAQAPSPTPAPTEEPTPPASHEVTLVRVLAQAPAAERLERIAEYVEKEVTQVLRLPGGRSPDRRHRLMDLGFDSLMAVEFRNRLQVGLGLDALPATLVFDYPTVDAIATYVGGQLLASGNEAEDATAPPAEAGTAEAVKRVEELSEEEAEARLLERLGDLEGR